MIAREQKSTLLTYEAFKDPGQVYRELSQAQRVKSLAAEEEAFGEELAEEFSSWSDFSAKTYELFVREIAAHLKEANQGYGRGMACQEVFI